MTTLSLPRFNTLQELVSSDFGCYQNIFFANKSDWSKVILMFNGAVTKQKMSINVDSAIYQRWSWHSHFKHPIFCIADPLTYGDDAIPLAWYQGLTKEVYLESVITEVKSAIFENTKQSKFISFGSSGGGFAALLCAQLGLVDSAIAINPQTDILNFFEKNALSLFLNKVKLCTEASDENYSLIRTGFSKVKDCCEITYLQNTCDQSHYEDHMTPYIRTLLESKKIDKLNLHCFTKPEFGHNPPPLQYITEVCGSAFAELLK